MLVPRKKGIKPAKGQGFIVSKLKVISHLWPSGPRLAANQRLETLDALKLE
jgi:hypothetical protein